MKKLLLTLLVILTAACAPRMSDATASEAPASLATMTLPLPRPSGTIVLSETPQTPIPTSPDTPTTLATTALPVEIITETLTVVGAPPACAFVWARQPLPELSAQVEAAMRASVHPQAQARAEAYGENCVDAQGKVVYFAAMETDFYVTLTVQDLTDLNILGQLTGQALAALDQFPTDQTPGPQPGYIGITFRVGAEALRLWFTVSAGEAARRQGLHGAELFAALGQKP